MAPEPKEALGHYLWGREIIDLLADFSSVTFTPAQFVSHLRKLQPRLYSISSSLHAFPEQVHLTVAAVRYDSLGRQRKGVCSTFLADRASGPVPVFVHVSKGFRLPASGDTPIIMVGPGTGIAPFRAFLQERQAAAAKGPAWLFFGHQRQNTDFLYEDELHQFLASGTLGKLSLAWSRDTDRKVYVQDKMRDEAEVLWSWIAGGAHFYVCGDAKRMAVDVEATLIAICEQHGGMDSARARQFLKDLRATGRYQTDVY
jgi:sulfite reductase (NADPH) flavoprotein alpha-component